MTESQKELLAYLEEQNAKTEAWIAEDPENRGAGVHITDMDFWAEEGIYSIEDYKLEGLRSEYYDMHRDLYGYKSWPNGSSIEEIEPQVQELRQQVQEAIRKEEEERARVQAIKDAAFDHTPINNPVIPMDFVLA
jgi:hypothetical protein